MSEPALHDLHRLAGALGSTAAVQAGQTMEVAATFLGGLDILDILDIVEERLADHDGRVELLARVLEAAGRSTLEAKVRALGRVLADGLADDDRIDEAFGLASAPDDLHAEHVLTLRYLAENPRPLQEMRGKNHPGPDGWEVAELATVVPDLDALVDPTAATLDRLGLLRAGGGATFLGSVGPPAFRIPRGAVPAS